MRLSWAPVLGGSGVTYVLAPDRALATALPDWEQRKAMLERRERERRAHP